MVNSVAMDFPEGIFPSPPLEARDRVTGFLQPLSTPFPLPPTPKTAEAVRYLERPRSPKYAPARPTPGHAAGMQHPMQQALTAHKAVDRAKVLLVTGRCPYRGSYCLRFSPSSFLRLEEPVERSRRRRCLPPRCVPDLACTARLRLMHRRCSAVRNSILNQSESPSRAMSNQSNQTHTHRAARHQGPRLSF